jgi:hypothetical protein
MCEVGLQRHRAQALLARVEGRRACLFVHGHDRAGDLAFCAGDDLVLLSSRDPQRSQGQGQNEDQT